MKEQMTCCMCNTALDDSEVNIFHDKTYCESCLDSVTVICDECGERIWNEDDVGDSNITLCSDCRNQYYYTCHECGALVHENCVYSENGHEYCPSCYDDLGDSIIEDYSYKPAPLFFGADNRYFGVELEIDEGGESDINAEMLLQIANAKDNHIYIKHDGSLKDGFEIVTHPMTLQYHKNSMPWKEITRKALALGYVSYNARSCGLHIHVNRSSFGTDTETQENNISKVLFFVEKHWDELLKFSRRTENQLNQWARRYGYKQNAKELLDHAKSSDLGRYACINLQNTDTIEFRIFRGSLNVNTIIATLQMVEKICNVAIFMSDEEIGALSWTTFVESIDQFTMPELIQYLKERRIYINEFVEAEEDV